MSEFKRKAEIALAKAKKQEMDKLKNDYAYFRTDGNTRVLQKKVPTAAMFTSNKLNALGKEVSKQTYYTAKGHHIHSRRTPENDGACQLIVHYLKDREYKTHKLVGEVGTTEFVRRYMAFKIMESVDVFRVISVRGGLHESRKNALGQECVVEEFVWEKYTTRENMIEIFDNNKRLLKCAKNY